MTEFFLALDDVKERYRRKRSSSLEIISSMVPPSSWGYNGPPRILDSIIAGPLFSNDEGRRWFKDTYNYELAKNHSPRPRPQHMHLTWRFNRRERHRLWVCRCHAGSSPGSAILSSSHKSIMVHSRLMALIVMRKSFRKIVSQFRVWRRKNWQRG